MTEKTQSAKQEEPTASAPEEDPVRTWTIRILVLSLILFAGYLMADRLTPLSSQARVHTRVVPIAAEVSGTLVEVVVENNQVVQAGDILFRVEDKRYRQHADSAAADLQTARQATGAAEAAVKVAEASAVSAAAGVARAQQDAVRLRRIKSQDPGALSTRRLEQAEATLIYAQQGFAMAEASVEQARQNLGRAGDDNSMVQQALVGLERATLDLERTTVVAPTNGIVTDVRVNRGSFAAAGAPLMTFISTDDIWVQADFTENNLGHVDRGDSVGLLFDVFPGRVFEGTVRVSGFGVAVESAPLGALPTIDNDRQWLRDAQRFAVVIDFEMSADEMRRLKVGAQVTAIVYASDSWFFNTLGALYIRIGSILSYAY